MPLLSIGLSLAVLGATGCSSKSGKGHVTGGDGGADQGVTDGGNPSGLIISPANPVITIVNNQIPAATSFTATLMGQPVTGNWSLDRAELGALTATGSFTAAGTLGGVGTVMLTTGDGKTGTTTVTVKLQQTTLGDPAANGAVDAGAGGYGGVGGDGPGKMPSSAQQTTLGSSPTADATVSILYPYNQTLWPRGMLAPLVQWNFGTHNFDSVSIHVQEANFDWQGEFASNTSGSFKNLPIPQAAWDLLGYSNAGEPVNVTVIFGEGANAYGPYTLTWKFAQATLKGTVYYNSYGTYQVANSDSPDKQGQQYGAGTLAIKPGALAPILVAGQPGWENSDTSKSGQGTGCRVCHTVSAHGDNQVLLTQHNFANYGYNSNDKKNEWSNDYSESDIINLNNDTTAGAGVALPNKNLTFPALSPDGKLALSSSGGSSQPDSSSQLYTVNTTTTPYSGLVPNVMGLPSGFQASLPMFSPDGTHVAFNFWNGTFPNGGPKGDQHSLAVLDFDGTATFSNPRVIYTPPASPGPYSVTWSSFVPTNDAIVFELEVDSSGGFANTWKNGNGGGNKGELWWIDLATHTPHRLDNLNGLNGPDNGAKGTHPPGIDATLNYEPTIDPIASGGYAWVVFTSRRMYGNVATADPWMSDPRDYDAHTVVTDKKLWVAAIDLNAAPGTDPSHPAFYLPAQEIQAGNARGFWTTDACHADNTPCVTGDECCGGYCSPEGDMGLVCSSKAPMCAAEFDKCTQSSDCCGYGVDPIGCINNICTRINPT